MHVYKTMSRGMVGHNCSKSKSTHLHNVVISFIKLRYIPIEDSSKTMGDFHVVVSFNRLIFQTQPVHVWLKIGSPRSMVQNDPKYILKIQGCNLIASVIVTLSNLTHPLRPSI